MRYNVNKLQFIQPPERLQKGLRKNSAKAATATSKPSTKVPATPKTSTITPKQAKALHKDLPPGGSWVTMRGHHVYIKDGKVLAGSVPGVTGAKKATKSQLTEHQAVINAEAKKVAKKNAKPATSKADGKATGKRGAGNGDNRNGATVKPAAKPAKPTASKRAQQAPVKPSEAKKPAPVKKPAAKPKKAVADVRTGGQTGHDLSYDVGERVFGSRKDLAQLRDDLNEKLKKGQSVRGVLASLERIDPGAAKKYCTKDNILQKFDWQAQHKQGVELPIAMVKKLVLDRIQPKPGKDDPETRRQYAYAIEELHRILTPMKTMDDLRGVRNALRDRMKLELPKHLNDQERYLDYAKKVAAQEPSEHDLTDRVYGKDGSVTRVPITVKEWKKRKAENVKKIEATMAQWHENAKNPYHVLGEKLTNFFTDYDSANNTINTVMRKNAKWEDYLEPQEKTATPPKRNRRAEWERRVDNPWDRKGGRAGKVQKPEDAVKQFGLRGVQFGHWVDDASGKFHLLKASEALQDMADTLGMQDKDVALNGRLAIAFGARGTGGKIAGGSAAAAHYEPNLRIINMTKEGGAGSLAHEWGHALDDIMADHSSIEGYASENPQDIKHPEVRQAYAELMDAINNGDGSHRGTVDVPNQKKTFGRYLPSRRKMVQEQGLTPQVVQHWTDSINRQFDAEKRDLMRHVSGERSYFSDPEKAKKKLKTLDSRRKREINQLHQELMNDHYRVTGNHVDSMKVTSEGSEYLNRMRELDGESKSYYATEREMFARVFESWMQETMKAKGNHNSYLVAGTKESPDAPFPVGSERKHMFGKMGKLMKTIVGTGEIKKALEFDLQKAVELSGGEWKTVMHRHVYIKDGEIVAGGIPKGAKEHGSEGRGAPDQKGDRPHAGRASEGTEGGGKDGRADRKNSGTIQLGKHAAKIVGTFLGADGSYTYHEVKGAGAFHAAIMDAKNADASTGAFVHAYEPDEYEGKRLFVTPGGEAGFAVTDDGDIVSVFKHPEKSKGKKGVALDMLYVALQNGGNKLDCFDGHLSKIYAKLGFEPVSKTPFNREYAPEGWDYDAYGAPDVVFFKHNGDNPSEVKRHMGEDPYPSVDTAKVKAYDDYDGAMEARNDMLQKSHASDMIRDIERVTGKPVEWKPLSGTTRRNAYQVSHTTDPSEVLYIPVNRLHMVYQTEEATDWDKVKENMDKMRAGEALEPVVIGYDYDVHDGHHKWIAAKGLDHTHVPCEVGGTDELRKMEAMERYRELWKSVVTDPTGGLPADPYTMYRGIGQKELDFINAKGFVQSKGKGNDGDQGKVVTCFTNLFTQAEGYARSNYTLYGEKSAYVIALPRPPWVYENDLGELESDRPVPFHLGVVIPIPNPDESKE